MLSPELEPSNFHWLTGIFAQQSGLLLYRLPRFARILCRNVAAVECYCDRRQLHLSSVVGFGT